METESRSNYRFVIEIIIIAILVCVGLVWVGPGPLFPMIMQEYGVDRVTVSWTTSIVPLGLAIFAIPAGILASKIGLKKTFTIGAFLMAGGVLTPLCSNVTQLLATRVVYAIGCAMSFPIAGGLVMQWFKGKELPLVNGFNICATSVGNAIAMFTAVLVANASGWKVSLALYGAGALVFALLCSWLSVPGCQLIIMRCLVCH